jgi:mRNA-degrading endonuclease toxin of MazEF toxin-antitoxin module
MISEEVVFDRWDVAVALFPFTDIAVRKPRPVLVLSDRAFNRSHGHFIAAMITTGVDSRWPSDCPINDLQSCGLRHASVVRWKLFTLPKEVAPRRIGALGAIDRRQMTERLGAVLPEA